MTYWTACYTEPGGEIKARAGIENSGRGAFIPTFVANFVRRGQIKSSECPLLGRYVLIALNDSTDEIWSKIGQLDGVQRVMTNDGKPSRVSEAEVSRLMLAHASGAYNRAAAGRFQNKKRRRRARPRPGRTVRSSTYIVGQQINVMHDAS